MKNVYDLSLTQWTEAVAAMGEPAYRAKQIYTGLMRGIMLSDINVPKALAAKLSEAYITKPVEIALTKVSADGTEKYLFRLFDGNIIEGVLLRQDYGNTLCVSTQVGCRMGCEFCASTKGGLIRSLSAGEMLAQVVLINAQTSAAEGAGSGGRGVKNIVLMGSGEPLDNFDNVVSFLRLVSCDGGLNISPRNISLSTCGLAKDIKRFADLKLPVTLSLSLHSPFDEGRRRIMPIANKYSVAEIMDSMRYYFEKTGRRVIIEYSMISGENCSDKDALELKKIMKNLSAHVNLIRLNPVTESSLAPCTEKEAKAFLSKLTTLGISATIRRQAGVDIDGACGQLRNKFVGQKDIKI